MDYGSSLEIKADSVAADGSFEGLAAVFGERDQGGDIIEPGAFAKSLKKRPAAAVKMLTDHDVRARIGVWDSIEETDAGLKVRGRLLLEKQIAKDAYVDLKAGALDGMSIGYMTINSANDGRRRARVLKEIDLFEISLVPFPMQDGARVSSVKGMLDLTSEECGEIEAILRMKDLSQRDAKRAISGLKEWLRRDVGVKSDEPRDEEIGDHIRARLDALANVIRK